MLLFVTLLHIILCFVLMLVILLQPGKGSDVDAAFGGGGGSSTIFGPRGAGSFLSQATTIVAVLFMFTSVTLAIYTNAAMSSGSDVEDAINKLMAEEGEMYTIPEEDRYAAPEEQALPEELLTDDPPGEQPTPAEPEAILEGQPDEAPAEPLPGDEAETTDAPADQAPTEGPAPLLEPAAEGTPAEG